MRLGERTDAAASTGRLQGNVISTGERKAIEAAETIVAKLNVDAEVREAMHDRSATGFLLPDEFEAVANQFFRATQHQHSGLGASRRCPVAYCSRGRTRPGSK